MIIKITIHSGGRVTIPTTTTTQQHNPICGGNFELFAFGLG